MHRVYIINFTDFRLKYDLEKDVLMIVNYTWKLDYR